MKLILVEYLASLKERGELDVILPDLLSEIGMSVFSRPAIGTRQYGVDVGAVGGAEGEHKVFLISIKPGDLKRAGWNAGQQSLRASLDEIQDVYIPKLLPGRYKDLPVVIVLCLGGELHEGVRTNVESYIDNHTREGLEFEVWNGDMLAQHSPSSADTVVRVDVMESGGAIPANPFPPVGFQVRGCGLRRLRIACLSCASSGCW